VHLLRSICNSPDKKGFKPNPFCEGGTLKNRGKGGAEWTGEERGPFLCHRLTTTRPSPSGVTRDLRHMNQLGAGRKVRGGGLIRDDLELKDLVRL